MLVKSIDLKKIPVETVIQQTVDCLQHGGLVIFPTETTYGAGVDATNQTAVDKLLAYKARREGKPLSIAVTDQVMAEQYVEINEAASRVYQRFLPGPVTVVSHSRGNVATGVASEFNTLGVRIPDYQLIIDIIKKLGQPITATSANASGEKRPYTIQDIFDRLSEKQKSLIDLVLDAGTLPTNPPSTVIDTTLSTPVTLRVGSITSTEWNSTNHTSLVSQNEAETKHIAHRLLLKHWDQIKAQGLVMGLDGPLGVGKTIFAKGAAEFLQINEPITSPTYTYIQEYDWQRYGVTGRFYHLDMWKIDDQQSFDKLEVPSLLKPNTVMVIEWWNQVADFTKNFQLPINLHLSINQLDQQRELVITET